MMRKKVIVIGLIIIILSNVGLYMFLQKYYKDAHYAMVEEDLMENSDEIEAVYESVKANINSMDLEYKRDIEERYLLLSESILRYIHDFASNDPDMDEYNRNSQNNIVLLTSDFKPLTSIPTSMIDKLRVIQEYYHEKKKFSEKIIDTPYGEVFIRVVEEDQKIIVIEIEDDYKDELNDIKSVLLGYLEERVGNLDGNVIGMIFDEGIEIGISNSKVMDLHDARFYNENKLLLKKSVGKFTLMNKYCKEKNENKSIYTYVKESSDGNKLIVSYTDYNDIKSALEKYNKLVLTFNLLSALTLLIIGFLLHDLLDVGSR